MKSLLVEPVLVGLVTAVSTVVVPRSVGARLTLRF
jgi:hypothetical protein